MKYRIFIAINLPQKIKQELSDLILSLQNVNSNLGIKWIKPENLHITLHFLGYLDKKQIEKVKKIIDLRFKNQDLKFKNFELRFIKIDGFPNMNQPKIIFVETEELRNGNLIRFQKTLGEDLEKAGFKVDHRPWQPHITLARVKTPIPKFHIPKFQIPNSKFKIKSVDLMESELKKDGARYKKIYEVQI